LAKKILGSDLDFDLENFVSPRPATSVAKKSALIEAIEGHRAEPRNKPPFPGQMGALAKAHSELIMSKPFANVPQILGARRRVVSNPRGVSGSRGLKFVGVSGQVEHPGVFEVPNGHLHERSDLWPRRWEFAAAKKLESVRSFRTLLQVICPPQMVEV